jgi:hypothetical protein
MILTKGIIKGPAKSKKKNMYSVEIPLFTETYDATVCTLPYCDLTLGVDDIVYVGFEHGYFECPIIFGVLHLASGNTNLDNRNKASLSLNELSSDGLKVKDNNLNFVDDNGTKSIVELIKDNALSSLTDALGGSNNNSSSSVDSIQIIRESLVNPLTLQEDVTYGKKLPSNPTDGQLFFLIEE